MRPVRCAGVCALLVAVGCGGISPRPQIEGLVYGVQPYNDLPVPSDFTFDESDRSWAFRLYEESPLNLRSAVLRYVGDWDVGQAVNWYATQMPEHGWAKTSFNMDGQRRHATVVFKRESEEATVELIRELGLRRSEPYTVLYVKLGVAPTLQ